MLNPESQLTSSKGVGDSEWDRAFLVTAPRFLGYSFNPVSFWYIYDRRRHLVMMILEVNNTFDERRLYLLNATACQKSDDDAPSYKYDWSRSNRFKTAWAKDFHVSPFNSRKGHYTLTATDAFKDAANSENVIDNTIVLKSSKDQVKLVARIFSEGPSVDPAVATTFETARFLSRYFWVGFVTFPRILKEAFILYFRRKLHVWFRPEVLPTSMGRHPTESEE
jgi:DUF1365 family protein